MVVDHKSLKKNSKFVPTLNNLGKSGVSYIKQTQIKHFSIMISFS